MSELNDPDDILDSFELKEEAITELAQASEGILLTFTPEGTFCMTSFGLTLARAAFLIASLNAQFHKDLLGDEEKA